MSSYISNVQVRPVQYVTSTMKSEHLPSILHKLNEDRKTTQRYCDVTILAGSGIFPVHLCIVGSYLDFFEKIFNAEMREGHERIAKIYEIDEVTMEAVLNFIYTSEISVNKENVREILKAADYFQIETVKDFCLKFMYDQVDFENCLSFEAYGRLFEHEEMREKVGAMISSRLDLVLKEEEFKELEFDEFNDLLSLEHKRISSQDVLYEAIIKWLRHQPNERCGYVQQLFSFVLVEKMSRSFLNDKVLKDDLINTSLPCMQRIFQILMQRLRNGTNSNFNRNTFGFQKNVKENRKLRSKNLQSFNTSSTLPCVDEEFMVLDFKSLLKYLNSKNMLEDCRYYTSMTWSQHDPERKKYLSRLMQQIVVENLTDELLLNSVFYNKFFVEDMNTCLHFVKGLLARRTETSGIHLLILGGSRRKTFRYDVINKDISSLPFLRRGRNGASIVRHKTKVYVIGGYKTKSVESLDLSYSSSNWEEEKAMKNVRVGAAATVFGDCIYVIGGRASANSSSTSHKSSTGEKLDTRLNKWTHVSSSIEAKCFHALIQANGLLYAVGPQNLDVFHPRYNTWRRLSQLQTSRTGLAAVVLKGKIYAIGGYNENYLSSVEVYNYEDDSWSFVAELNKPRSFHGACVINDRIYVAGGNSDAIESYDSINNKWEIEMRVNDTMWMDCVVAV